MLGSLGSLGSPILSVRTAGIVPTHPPWSAGTAPSHSANSTRDPAAWRRRSRRRASGSGTGWRSSRRTGSSSSTSIFGLAKLGAVGVAGELAAGGTGDAAISSRTRSRGDRGRSAVLRPHRSHRGPAHRPHGVAIGAHDRWPVFDDWVAAHPAVDPGVTTGPDDVVLQLYTSGTTGLPKGVMLTNSNCSGALDVARRWRSTTTSCAWPRCRCSTSAAPAGRTSRWRAAATVVLARRSTRRRSCDTDREGTASPTRSWCPRCSR